MQKAIKTVKYPAGHLLVTTKGRLSKARQESRAYQKEAILAIKTNRRAGRIYSHTVRTAKRYREDRIEVQHKN